MFISNEIHIRECPADMSHHRQLLVFDMNPLEKENKSKNMSSVFFRILLLLPIVGSYSSIKLNEDEKKTQDNNEKYLFRNTDWFWISWIVNALLPTPPAVELKKNKRNKRFFFIIIFQKKNQSTSDDDELVFSHDVARLVFVLNRYYESKQREREKNKQIET